MNHIVCLEGPDNIGKTFLAKEMMGKYGALYHHVGAPKSSGPEAQKEQECQVRAIMRTCEWIDLEQKNQTHVYDRSMFGELVYGPLFRQYTPFFAQRIIRDQMKLLTQTKVMLIVLYADDHTYQKFGIPTKVDEKVLYQQRTSSQSISVGFVEMATTMTDVCQVLLVNCNNYDSLEYRNKYIHERVLAFLADRQYRHRVTGDYSHTFFNPLQTIWSGKSGFVDVNGAQCSLYDDGSCALGRQHHEFSQFGTTHNRPTSFVGRAENPVYIFVGEAPGYNGCGKLGIPFYDDLSGNLFQTTLEELKILPTQYWMTNVIRCCPKENQLGKFSKLEERIKLECVERLGHHLEPGSAKVVAIGSVADKTLGFYKIPHVAMYHPAYFCRLGKSGQYTEYVKSVLC